jgi:LDH2 family malate/lactate/ureidoglycolate dehydrogenase
MSVAQPEPNPRPTIRISVNELQDRLIAAFINDGLPVDAATHSAEALVEAECAGKSSHGLIRLDFVSSHTRLKQPGPVVFGGSGPCHLAVDGNRHMGYHPGVLALERGCDIASQTGLCLVAIRNIGHSGMLAFYARRIARKGYWGMVFGHCTALMAPHGGSRSIFGTNPLALGIPGGEGAPLAIDFSPAATTFGAVTVAAQTGCSLPEGLALDGAGRPSVDPAAVMDGGALLPAGGHKGSALALMVQLLCGALGGAGPLPAKSTDYGLCFLIIRPDLFRPAGETATAVDTILAAVSGCPPLVGHAAVRVPGEQSSRAIAAALQHGLDVDRGLWEKLLDLAGRST